MTIQETRSGEAVTLSVDGDITMGDAGAHLARRVRSLAQERHGLVVLDLGRVRYVDSAGLGELIQCCVAARARGGRLELVNVTRRLHDLLVVTKLFTVFDYQHRAGDVLHEV